MYNSATGVQRLVEFSASLHKHLSNEHGTPHACVSRHHVTIRVHTYNTCTADDTHTRTHTVHTCLLASQASPHHRWRMGLVYERPATTPNFHQLVTTQLHTSWHLPPIPRVRTRGFHPSTSLLSLSRFCHFGTQRIPQKMLTLSRRL